MGAADEARAQRPDHGAVGADQRILAVQAEFAEDAHGIGVATPGGDDDLRACLFGGEQRGAIARAYAAV